MTSQDRIDQLRATVIDGRTDNVRYRQNELHALHASLRNNAEAILSAISEDQSSTTRSVTSEARSEYFLAMHAIKQAYASLNFEASLKDEYQVANGSDNLSRRVGKGLVIIRPTTHTRFYSIISPLASAIAAGNCVITETGTTMKIDGILKNELFKAMDPDSFFISTSNVQDQKVLETAFLVDQVSNDLTSNHNHLASNSAARTIAVVDRDADIELAAKAIVNSRFSFQGSSPYSPDLVIVNDFVKSEFIEACTRNASKFFSSSTKTDRRPSSNEASTKKVIKEEESKGNLSVFGSSNCVILDVRERNSPITKMKISGCHLSIIESTSLTDAITSQGSNRPLAAYIFSKDLATAKFLSQHLNASASYINQIPLHLLLGPAAPISSSPNPSCHKYNAEMFSNPTPQYIAMSPQSVDSFLIDEFLGQPEQSKAGRLALEKIQKAAVEPLPKTGQSQGFAVGFFEQGIFLGGGLFLAFFLPALGYGTWVLGRSGWRFANARF